MRSKKAGKADAQKAKNVENMINSQFSMLKKFFQFLKESKSVERFNESFFENDQTETLNDYFIFISNSDLTSSSIRDYCSLLIKFFKFCCEKYEQVSLSDLRRRNAESMMKRSREELKRWSKLAAPVSLAKDKIKPKKKAKQKPKKEVDYNDESFEEEKKEDSSEQVLSKSLVEMNTV